MDDEAKAVSYIFENKEKYMVDTENYSLWGASAGGHLVGMFGLTKIGYAKYGLEKSGALILSYPLISMQRKVTHMRSHDILLGKDADSDLEDLASIELQIDQNYPRTFIWCFENDRTVNSENTKRMARTLKENHVDHECLIFNGELHGVGPGSDTAAESRIDQAYDFWRKK